MIGGMRKFGKRLLSSRLHEQEGKRAWREEVEGRQDLGNYKDRQLVIIFY